MNEKLCVFCEHFDWESIGYVGYGTLTGGSIEGGLNCSKGCFYDENPSDTSDFRELILRAETCKYYTPPTE